MNFYAARTSMLALVVLTLSPVARPSLGGVETTVQDDSLATNATLHTSVSAKYTVHELQSAAGATVREFVSPAGIVFAVAWQGPTLPDLRLLLGAHFDDYIAASASRRTRRSAVIVRLPDLVVQSSGHMRAFSGKAYLPAALPSGVAAEEIR